MWPFFDEVFRLCPYGLHHFHPDLVIAHGRVIVWQYFWHAEPAVAAFAKGLSAIYDGGIFTDGGGSRGLSFCDQLGGCFRVGDWGGG